MLTVKCAKGVKSLFHIQYTSTSLAEALEKQDSKKVKRNRMMYIRSVCW